VLAVTTCTTISCSLGRQYGRVLSLSFLDVYGSDINTNNPICISLPKVAKASNVAVAVTRQFYFKKLHLFIIALDILLKLSMETNELAYSGLGLVTR
jgi:hypothetical protein